MNTITWIVSALALAGVVLNINKDPRCFIIWACTNFFWCIYDWCIGAYAQSVLFAVYFILAAVGLWKWRKDDVGKNKTAG